MMRRVQQANAGALRMAGAWHEAARGPVRACASAGHTCVRGAAAGEPCTFQDLSIAAAALPKLPPHAAAPADEARASACARPPASRPAAAAACREGSVVSAAGCVRALGAAGEAGSRVAGSLLACVLRAVIAW